MTFIFEPYILPGLVLIKPQIYYDERGWFSESFKTSDFTLIGLPPFVQENHSRSIGPVFRGLHYQLNPKAQGKLIRCVSGSIIDVAVDIRKGSPTYKHYATINLDETVMFYIPPGFAHGFYAAGNADVIYKTTEYFSLECDRSIRWNDPDLNINIQMTNVKISEKDRLAPCLKDADNNFVF